MTTPVLDEPKVDALLTRAVAQVVNATDLKKKLMSGQRLRVKLGIDPTGPALHLGRSIPLLKLRDFQELGHQIVLIIGSFTGQIGDTSDKDAERPMLTAAQVKKNMAGYLDQIGLILDMNEVEVHYNDEWLNDLSFSDVIKLADAFSLHEFTAREIIKKRLDAGKRINLRELLYPLMQGYDSVAVKADVEIGGTDQWFNLLTGRSVQPLYGQVGQDVMTLDLIDGTDGQKMSTSRGNTVLLTASAEEMYGAIMSVRDELIVPYYRLLTRVPLGEVSALEARLQAGENPRDMKMRLAAAITELYHGATESARAATAFATVFQKGERPESIPIIRLKRGERPLADVLVEAKLTESKSEARRLISQGGVRVDDAVVADAAGVIDLHDGLILQVGKRRWAEVRTDER